MPKIQIQKIIITFRMGQQNTKSHLSIRISSSETQSQELYDFHKLSIKQDQKTLRSSSYLVDFGETVKLVHNQAIVQDQGEVPDFAIYKITQDEYQQIKITAVGNGENKTLWRVIKHGETYPLKIGETLKIGKIQVEFKRIVTVRNERVSQQVTEKESFIDSLQDTKSLHSEESDAHRCRICFQSHTTKTDPLVCLCKCTGSIKYIHFMCLKDWITNGFQKRQEENYKFYTYNEMSCELCKEKLPTHFKHEGNDYSFFEMDVDAPYAEFESITEVNGKKTFSRYIIDLSKTREALIGRNSTCQVVMKDISISRVHCSLEYKHGMLFVRDKKSKFGTLVKVDRPIDFNSQSGIQLQFDSHMIDIYKRGGLKGCCCFNIDSYKLIYEQGNRRSFNSRRPAVTRGRYEFTSQNEEELESQQNPSMMRTRIMRNDEL